MSSQAALQPRPFSVLSTVDRIGGSLVARRPALRRVLLAAFISTCGDRLHQVALAALVLGIDNSMTAAGLVFVVSAIPYALFGLPLGALVDRWDRRTVMIGADLFRGALVLVLPFAAAVNLSLVYPLLFCLTCATMLFAPARQAAIPELVEDHELNTANTLFQVINYLGDLLAFPIAGVLVAAFIQGLGLRQGTFASFGFDAFSYLLSAALLCGASMARTTSAVIATPLRRSISEGLRFLHGNLQVRTNTLLLTVGPLLLGSLHTLLIGFAWNVSHTGTLGYGMVETAYAVGTLAGVWIMDRLSARLNPGRVILCGFAIMGSAMATAGWTDSLPVMAALAAASGVGNMLFLVPSITLVQRHTPAELRGRVMAIRFMLTFGAFAISNALAGALADSIGVSKLFLVLGGGMLLMAVVASAWRSAREAA